MTAQEKKQKRSANIQEKRESVDKQRPAIETDKQIDGSSWFGQNDKMTTSAKTASILNGAFTPYVNRPPIEKIK